MVALARVMLRILSVKIILVAVIWIGFWVALDYAMTGMKNDAIDNKLGTIAGVGTVCILLGGFILRRRAN